MNFIKYSTTFRIIFLDIDRYTGTCSKPLCSFAVRPLSALGATGTRSWWSHWKTRRRWNLRGDTQRGLGHLFTSEHFANGVVSLVVLPANMVILHDFTLETCGPLFDLLRMDKIGMYMDVLAKNVMFISVTRFGVRRGCSGPLQPRWHSRLQGGSLKRNTRFVDDVL